MDDMYFVMENTLGTDVEIISDLVSKTLSNIPGKVKALGECRIRGNHYFIPLVGIPGTIMIATNYDQNMICIIVQMHRNFWNELEDLFLFLKEILRITGNKFLFMSRDPEDSSYKQGYVFDGIFGIESDCVSFLKKHIEYRYKLVLDDDVIKSRLENDSVLKKTYDDFSYFQFYSYETDQRNFYDQIEKLKNE